MNPKPHLRSILGWCLFDWANSAYPTLILTFVFATYFTKGVAETPAQGLADWGIAAAISALLIALAAPPLGAIADSAGRRKPWLAALTLLCAAASTGLWWIEPDPSFVLPALILVILATAGFELGMVFYNAMLDDVAPSGMVGRISGWGWGLGYAGGLAALIIALLFLIKPDPPLFGLNKAAAEPVRAVALLAGAWITFFALPLFFWTPDRPSTGVSAAQAVRQGFATLIATVRRLPEYRMVLRFLIARMIYTDGLNTLFQFGGIFAAVTFGFTQEKVLLFGIAINVTAGLGAAGFAILDDRIGPKPVIILSVGAIAVIGGVMIFTTNEVLFWILGLALGIFLGPAQSASRSLMARIAPPELMTEFFGLYALSGKATAFLGPALFSLIVTMTGSQRWALATIIPFLLLGIVLLRKVRP